MRQVIQLCYNQCNTGCRGRTPVKNPVHFITYIYTLTAPFATWEFATKPWPNRMKYTCDDWNEWFGYVTGTGPQPCLTQMGHVWPCALPPPTPTSIINPNTCTILWLAKHHQGPFSHALITYHDLFIRVYKAIVRGSLNSIAICASHIMPTGNHKR